MSLNLLYVCSKNQWRSPTAESIYRQDNRVNVRSVGTSTKARQKISSKHLAWADLVLVMENKHKRIIKERFRHLDLPDIYVLDIPDDYQYMSAELVVMIKLSTEAILSQHHLDN